MGLICQAQEPRRDVPALTVVGDDRDGLPIVASQPIPNREPLLQ